MNNIFENVSVQNQSDKIKLLRSCFAGKTFEEICTSTTLYDLKFDLFTNVISNWPNKSAPKNLTSNLRPPSKKTMKTYISHIKMAWYKLGILLTKGTLINPFINTGEALRTTHFFFKIFEFFP